MSKYISCFLNNYGHCCYLFHLHYFMTFFMSLLSIFLYQMWKSWNRSIYNEYLFLYCVSCCRGCLCCLLINVELSQYLFIFCCFYSLSSVLILNVLASSRCILAIWWCLSLYSVSTVYGHPLLISLNYFCLYLTESDKPLARKVVRKTCIYFFMKALGFLNSATFCCVLHVVFSFYHMV